MSAYHVLRISENIWKIFRGDCKVDQVLPVTEVAGNDRFGGEILLELHATLEKLMILI